MTKETKPDRSCGTCEFENRLCTAYPCSECYREGFHPNYKPKQVYISTANIHCNGFFDPARYALGVNPYDAIKDTINNTYGVASIKEPKKVIFNDPATIVFWNDGTKTVVKAVDEPFDPEKGLAMAISKKYLGNEGNYYNTFKKWLPEEGVITFDSKAIEAFKDLEKKTKLVFDTLSCLAKKE